MQSITCSGGCRTQCARSNHITSGLFGPLHDTGLTADNMAFTASLSFRYQLSSIDVLLSASEVAPPNISTVFHRNLTHHYCQDPVADWWSGIEADACSFSDRITSQVCRDIGPVSVPNPTLFKPCHGPMPARLSSRIFRKSARSYPTSRLFPCSSNGCKRMVNSAILAFESYLSDHEFHPALGRFQRE